MNISKKKLTPRSVAIISGGLASFGWLLDNPLGKNHPFALVALVALAMGICWIWFEETTTRMRLSASTVGLLAWSSSANLLLFYSGWSAIWSLCVSSTFAILTVIGLGKRWIPASASAFLVIALTSIHLLVGLQLVYSVALLYLPDTLWFDRISHWIYSPFASLWMSEDGLLFFDGRSVEGYHVSLELTHIVWAVRFYLIWVAIGLFTGRWNWKLASYGGLCVAAVLITWSLFSFSAFVIMREPLIGLNRWFAAISEVAAIFIVVTLIPKSYLDAHLLEPEPIYAYKGGDNVAGKSTLGIGWREIVLIASVCLVALPSFWFPVGTRKEKGEILLDDGHSNWEVSDLPFDFSNQAFSKRAGYSYSSFADALGMHYKVRIRREAITRDSLAGVSVLILKTPTNPFSEAEMEAIRGFVQNGGGLFVHGDHTNLYGMSTILNELLEPMGVGFNFDDQANFQGQPSSLDLNRRAYRHPCVDGIGGIQFLTSCTLSLRTCLAEPVMIGEGIFSEKLNHGRPGFFGNMIFDPRDRYGLFAQAAVVPYGKGRVAVFADSTLFSNFTLYSGSQVEYAMRTLDYLHGTPSNIRAICLGMGLLLLGTCICRSLFRSTDRFVFLAHSFVIASSVGLTLAVMLSMVLGWMESSLDPLEGKNEVDVCIGDGTVVNALMDVESNDVTRLRDFGSFLTVIQRLGYRPRMLEHVKHKSSRPLVWINPNGELSNSDVNELANEIKMEGKQLLIVMDDSNQDRNALALIQNLGMSVSRFTAKVEGAHLVQAPPLDDTVADGLPFLLDRFTDMKARGLFALAKPDSGGTFLSSQRAFIGGETLVWNRHGVPLLTARFFPSGGKLLIFTESASFSSFHLGGGFMKSLEPSEIDAQKSVAAILAHVGLTKTEASLLSQAEK